MTLYLAIDGGNSKTDVVIGSISGEIIGYANGPGTCHQNIGLAETMSRLETLVTRAREAAGLPDSTRFLRADVFLAGADLPEDIEMLSASIAARGWSESLRLDNDTWALLRSGTDAPNAVAVVCGHGINCLGRTQDDRIFRLPALGTISGDWGGGGDIGALALWHAIRSEDGRGPATALVAAIIDHFGVSSATDLSRRLYHGTVESSDVGRLTPAVLATAAARDPIALSIVDRLVHEIITMATAAARRLELLGEPFTVVLGGGVLRSRHPLLVPPIVEGIQAVAPKATTTVVDSRPILGAALYALDALGADPSAHEAVRQAVHALTPLRRPLDA
jgi:N-acetylglucosamine kinase-like BadF-type ATPase